MCVCCNSNGRSAEGEADIDINLLSLQKYWPAILTVRQTDTHTHTSTHTHTHTHTEARKHLCSEVIKQKDETEYEAVVKKKSS